MQRLEVSGAVRLIYKSLGVKGLIMSGGTSLLPQYAFMTRTGKLYLPPCYVLCAFLLIASLINQLIN